MGYRIRRNILSSQHVELALVYKEMLGDAEAIAYLGQENIPASIAERVINTNKKRGRLESASSYPTRSVLSLGCRRKNNLHDAIVEAAVKIEAKLGRQWAVNLLKEEGVPDAVADRILAQGPRQLRAKKNAN